jgi:hypothetical protein
METTVLLCRLSGDCGRTCECVGDEDCWKNVGGFSSVQSDEEGEETGSVTGSLEHCNQYVCMCINITVCKRMYFNFTSLLTVQMPGEREAWLVYGHLWGVAIGKYV